MSTTKTVIVIGAGVGGLSAALALSRAGHRVMILERDDTPMPDRFADSFAWERQGAPQFHHSHAFLSRLNKILAERFPDVRDTLSAHGAPERQVATLLFGLPEGHPGSEELVVMPCRRTTYEWVLRTTILAEPNVELRTGVAVDGVIAAPQAEAGETPGICGVRLASGETVAADLVVATTGRRGDIPAWLAAVGVDVAEEEHESGISYISRFYRTRPGHDATEFGYAIARRAGLGYCGFEADNETFSLTMVVDPADSELRRHLLDEDRFDATCQILPELAEILDPATVEAITPVHPMGGLINRLRTFADDAGRPLVRGFFALGDAYMVTNPVYARGCTAAMIQAVALADALSEHPDDPLAQSVAYEAVAAREIVPWFHLSVLMDQMTASSDGGDDFAATGALGLSVDLGDASATVAFARVFTMLDPLERLYLDPVLMSAFSKVLSEGRPAVDPGVQITRDDLLNATAAA